MSTGPNKQPVGHSGTSATVVLPDPTTLTQPDKETASILAYSGGLFRTALAALLPFTFLIPGTATIAITPSEKVAAAMTFVGARLRANTGPIGTALTAQPQFSLDNGVTWNSLGGVLSMAAGTSVPVSTAFSQAITAANVTSGALVRVSVTAVGTTPAVGVAVDLIWA